MNKIEYKYDIAISFAEANRPIAKLIAKAINFEALSTYFYPSSRAENLGQELKESLTRIFSEEAKYAVVLFSNEYLNSEVALWELEAIRTRMASDTSTVYMIPVKITDNVDLGGWPDIINLVFYPWMDNEDELARILKTTLGKDITSESGDGIDRFQIYNSGENPTYILGVNEIQLDNSQNNEVLIEAESIINSVIAGGDIFNISSPNEKIVVCPFCLKEYKYKNVGKNTCLHCEKIFFIDSPIKTRTFPTLTIDEERKYNKILAHIFNKLDQKKYTIAYDYCLEAEQIAPAEPVTWENFAWTEFLLEISKEKSIRKNTYDIIKGVKSHIDKAKYYGISDEEFEELIINISNKLFYIERSRLNSFRPQIRDKSGVEKWTRQNLYSLLPFLKSYDLSISLYNKEPVFVEEYIIELSKPYKWVVKSLEDNELRNTFTLGSFNATEKLKSLVRKMLELKPSYIAPEVKYERLEILEITTHENISESKIGEDVNVSGIFTFNIISKI